MKHVSNTFLKRLTRARTTHIASSHMKRDLHKNALKKSN